MVCLSGGKDSYGLLDILLSLQETRAACRSSSSRSTSTRSSPGFPPTCCRVTSTERGVAFRIAEQDTYSVVKRLIPEGATMCSLCSRLRRGVLYRVAGELGATKIALGHHRDDLLATFFLNLFFGGKLKTMPPKLVSDDGQPRRDPPARLRARARPRRLCRSDGRSRSSRARCAARRRTCSASRSARCCANGNASFPGRIESIFNAMGNVVPTHLLDRELQDFSRVSRNGRFPTPDGDIAFDADDSLPREAAEAVIALVDAALTRALRRLRSCERQHERRTPCCDLANAGLLAVACAVTVAAPADSPGVADGHRVARRAAARWLRALLSPRRDGLRPERRQMTRLRGLRAAAQPHRSAAAPMRERSARRFGGCTSRSRRCSRARSAARRETARARVSAVRTADARACAAALPQTDDRERYAALKTLLSTPAAPGANLAIVSHGNPFHALAGAPYLAEGEMAVVEPLGAMSGFRIVAKVPRTAGTLCIRAC